MEKLTNKVVFDRLVALYGEIATLEQDITAVTDEAKDVLGSNIDIANIKKLAKLSATDKVGSAIEKMKAFIELTEKIA